MKTKKTKQNQIFIKTAFVAISLISQMLLNAQITINSSDMPYPNDTIRISTGLNLDFIDYTETGEDFTWDFSDLMPVFQTIDTFISPSQTPFIYQIFFVQYSNLAKRYIQDLPIPDFELSNVYYYYKNSDSQYDNVGYAASINGLPLPVRFSSPDVLYRFPFEYGNQDSSVSGIEYNIPGTGYLLIDRKRKNTVDGWGTLITPYGSFEVLRMISEVTEYDSVYIDSLETGVPVNRNYLEYKWLAKGKKIPLLQITSDLSGLIVTYQDSARINFDNVNEYIVKYESLKIYPNPASSELFVEFDLIRQGDLNIDIYDISGKQLYNKSMVDLANGVNRIMINLKNLSLADGTYLITIRADDQMVSRKVIIRN